MGTKTKALRPFPDWLRPAMLDAVSGLYDWNKKDAEMRLALRILSRRLTLSLNETKGTK